MAKNKGSVQENSNKTARKLVEVAIDLFSRKGFDGTSIRDIARETGMTTSNIYHHFGTKEGLLFAIEQATIEPILEELRKTSTLDMPPLDRLVLLMRTHLTYMGAQQKSSMVFFVNRETSSADENEYKIRVQREIFGIYRDGIEKVLLSIGKKGNPGIAALSMFGVMNWFLYWYRPDGPLPMQAVIEYIVDFLLYGITGSKRYLPQSEQAGEQEDKKMGR